MKLTICFPFLLVLFCSLQTNAQENPSIDFNKISVKDFSLEGIKVDTSHGAVIIADVGKSSFIANKKGFFSIVFKHQRRIKIISNKGFDIATVNIPLYKSTKSDDEETLESLKATTYNLVDGKVVETKLDKDNVFKEVQDRNHSLRKFTMPAVKEGSIIEYSYTVNSDFLFNLHPWTFQGLYPRLWSEYELNLPEFFDYVFLSKGYQPLHLKESKTKFQSYVIRIPGETVRENDQLINLSSDNTITRWVMKDIPSIKEESFTSTIDNHISNIEFQMSGQKFPNMPYKDIMGNWATMALDLMKDKDFGADFASENNWLAESMLTLHLEDKKPLEKAKIIYSWMQKNFSSKGMKGIYLSQTLKETNKTKKGHVSDLNLLLTLALKKAGLYAEPVLLSTRSNGFPTEAYPLIGQYNYVVSKLKIDSNSYYLDASKRYLGFNKLPQFCYNGAGISIDFNPAAEPLFPENITESKYTSILLLNDDTDKNKWIGNLSSYLGYYESSDIREEIEDKGKDTYVNKLKDSYNGEYSIDSIRIDALDNNEEVIKMNYLIFINRDDENNLIYFNPMIKEGMKENYFKSLERNYPVELPFKMEETYNFQIQIPEGYVIDELPKSAKVSLNDSDGVFEYIVSKNNTDVMLRTKIKLNKATFSTEEYEALKNFFDYIVKKHAEQIVFKKK